MLIKTLVENTTISKDYKCKHGICFYIETKNHKILFDLGQNDLFIKNAKKMNVDLKDIDICLISHGHIDHGGALRSFLAVNEKARIYIHKDAFDKHYTKLLGVLINVGLDDSIRNNKRVILTTENTKIDDELTLISEVCEKKLWSKSNDALYMKHKDRVEKDTFSHEQHLLIHEGNKYVLFSGCSHMGIVNIQNAVEKFIENKVSHVIGGFHLFNPVTRISESLSLMESIAKDLRVRNTMYYTCHCTGKKAYKIIKKSLHEKLEYLATGSVLNL